MRIKSGKLISSLVGVLALLLVVYGVLHSVITTAQTSFIGSLPPGYQAYPGQIEPSPSCSCSTVGITGAPEPLPRCARTNPCFGSSYTQYARFSTTVQGINSTYCDYRRQVRKLGFPCFQLDGDDAIVISGTMSPAQNLTYYSLAFYQTYTYNSKFPDDYTLTRSSLNLGLNNKTLKRGTNGKYVVIITANTNTLNVIKNSLRSIGVADATVNSYLIPASVTNLGTAYLPDQLSLLLRLTFQTDAEKQQVNTYIQQAAPATKVFFVKGPGIKGDITTDNLPKWRNTLRNNPIEYRLGLDQKLQALEDAVTQNYAQQGYRIKARLTEHLFHLNPDNCRNTPDNCGYDSPDAIYSFFPCDFSPGPNNNTCNIHLEKNSNDVLMLLGVNHGLVGDKTLAAYTSVESKAIPGSQDGTFAFLGIYAKGSANQYLPANDATNLYAAKITRSCSKAPYCASVPYLGGASENTGFFLLGRVYLDKATGSAPNPANLIPSTLLWFTKDQ